jgi:PAP2 superfamily
VITWNKIALEAIRTAKNSPPVATRNLAIVEAAVFDAVNSISRIYVPYHVSQTAPVGASPEAAAAEAAYRALIELYPTQKEVLDAALAASLAKIADSQSKTDGVALGKNVAEAMLTWRSTDGFNAASTYTPDPNKTPGKWQPTLPANGAAVLPQWGKIAPFIIANSATFLPAAPPSLTSDRYAQEYNQTKDLGSLTSTSRTADQTEIARFWANGGNTYTPPGHWNQIAGDTAKTNGNTLWENARLFGILNVALADAAIVCWDTKYTYDFWRPITAIQAGDRDGNDLTTVDPNWAPLLTTPAFPEYMSGHSTFSGAADAVLTATFGNNYAFTAGSPGVPGVTRSYTSFHQAAEESGISRIYGGIHFMSANVEGLKAGVKIGDIALSNFAKAI